MDIYTNDKTSKQPIRLFGNPFFSQANIEF